MAKKEGLCGHSRFKMEGVLCYYHLLYVLVPKTIDWRKYVKVSVMNYLLLVNFHFKSNNDQNLRKSYVNVIEEEEKIPFQDISNNIGQIHNIT